jgi:predicted NAD-dependent protein-ADP-ribosyltransferase YbiA (DUF1768 family)
MGRRRSLPLRADWEEIKDQVMLQGVLRKFETHASLGQLTKQSGTAIIIDDLWGLAFGNGALAGQTNQLFFTAGMGFLVS